ncbi:hypothetical protein ACROYT_G024403 [Oculina patagonica]
MSFVYVGTIDKYETRGHGRHLQNDSPTDEFDREMGNVEKDISTLGLIRNSEDQRVRETGYEKHAFNELISNRLGFNREIQDTRHEMCRSMTYSSNLPSASIIICFHNEAWSTLLRTVHSIFNRTAESLVREIILVDDLSTLEVLKDKLQNYVAEFPKLRLVRTSKREGLIRGRMLGAKQATGDVLVFLDSHCEVNKEWLPPLLERIKENPTTVVCPVIDIISSDTLEYQTSPLVRGGFNWGLHFSWESVPKHLLVKPEDFVQPRRSPTMAGGLFAMDRNYFNQLGQYDAGMNIWGGENLEISFRIWMCGGTLEIIPCSRVGHLFRKWRPYGSDSQGDTMSYNSMRVAEVWLDDYKKYFYQTKKDLVGKPFGNVTSRVALRKKLNCKSFKWYVENVYPELMLPQEGGAGNGGTWQHLSQKNPVILRKGNLLNVGSSLCLDTPGRASEKKASALLHNCHETNAKFWSLNQDNELKIDSLLCLEVTRHSNVPKVMKCHGQGETQEWRYNKKTLQLYHTASGLCMVSVGTSSVKMGICDDTDYQKWQFSYD